MGSLPFSRREKYTVGVLSFLAFALRIPLALRPERFLTGLPYGDDAYYLFSIARNLALGRGPTVDGTHLTNGFQPLILFLYTPIFWLCTPNSWLAVRSTIILNGVIAALTVWAVAMLLRRLEHKPHTSGLTAPIIGAAIWMAAFQIFAAMTNGLETGLSSLLLLVTLWMYAKLQSDHPQDSKISISQWSMFGLVLGLDVLARIDAAIIVAIIVLMLFVNRRLIEALVSGGMALLVSAPWWIFNWVSCGSLMPSSGQAEHSWPMPAGENIGQATKAISDILSLVFYLPGSFSVVWHVIWALLFIGALAYVCYRTRLIAHIRASFQLRALLPFLLFSFSLLIYYMFFFGAPHFISRYLQPMRVLWCIVVAVAVSVLWRKKIARWVILCAALLGLAFSVDGYIGDYFPAHRTFDFYEMGIWASKHPDEKIAMLQSGIASFIAPNIINLDGKVNADALRAHQKGRLAAYLRDENFTYIADWKPFIEDIAAITRKDELYFDSVGMIDKILLMKRRTATTPFTPHIGNPLKPDDDTHSN
jgi:hypothetical protein